MRTITGSIRLHRQVMASWVWELPPPAFKVFVHLLMAAAPHPGQVSVQNRPYNVETGQVVDRLQALAEDIGVSASTYSSHLNRLVAESFCDVETVGRGTVRVTIHNYERYQANPAPAPPRTEQPMEPTADSWQTTGDVSPVEPAQDSQTDQDEGEATTKVAEIMRAAHDRAMARQRRVKVILTERGGATRVSVRDRVVIYQQQWVDARPEDWVQLYEIFHRMATGVGSPEVAGMTKRDVNSLRPLVNKLLNKVLPQVFPDVADAAHGLLALYFVKTFQFISKKEAKVAREGAGYTNTPGLRDMLSDTKAIHRWAVNFGRELRRR